MDEDREIIPGQQWYHIGSALTGRVTSENHDTVEVLIGGSNVELPRSSFLREWRRDEG